MKIRRGVPRAVPLPRQLIEIMRVWKAQPGEKNHICASDFSRYLSKTIGKGVEDKPLVDAYVYKVVGWRVKQVTDKPFTIHGFRSTFTDWCALNRKPTDIVEMCLDHETRNVVRQAYFRDDLLEQRRELLQSYADALFAVKKEEEGEG